MELLAWSYSEELQVLVSYIQGFFGTGSRKLKDWNSKWVSLPRPTTRDPRTYTQ